MTNKERLELNNEKIEEITKTLAKKQVSPTDMLQQMVDQTKSCRYMFYFSACTNFDFLSKLNTSEVTNMTYTFYGCENITSLNLSGWNVDNVTTMSEMFDGCKRLKTIDLSLWNTKNLTNTSHMFKGCPSLTEIKLNRFNTNKITTTTNMFHSCGDLTTIPIIDMLSCTLDNNMFYYCTDLTNVTLKNIKINLQLGSGTSWGTLLSDESIINTFKELHDMTGTSSKTLTLSTPSNARTEQIYVKLVDVTDEMLAQDEYAGNKKPCVVCEPTDEGAMTLKEYGISKNWSIA